jgi:2-iminobutanoate/2-iminopropanoate deaminase
MMSETLRALLLCIGLVPCVACEPALGVKQVIASPQAPIALGAYSQAIRVGTTTYLAGQLPLDPTTSELIADPSIEAQTRQAIENLCAVLSADQMTLDNVVATQVFITDLAEGPRMNTVYASYFTGLAPARVVVQVAGLARNARIEISAIAVK